MGGGVEVGGFGHPCNAFWTAPSSSLISILGLPLASKLGQLANELFPRPTLTPISSSLIETVRLSLQSPRHRTGVGDGAGDALPTDVAVAAGVGDTPMRVVVGDALGGGLTVAVDVG